MTASSAQKSDLGWSQVRETVRMMTLAVAQIEMSMKQGEESVDTLAKAFTTMAARIQVIESFAQEESIEPKKILQQCEAVSAEMKHTIMAFQFYDILTQRLSHVSHSLESLTDLVGDSSRLYSPDEWLILQEKIKSKYSTSAEHDMFDMVMQGMSVKEALREQNDNKGEDVELF